MIIANKVLDILEEFSKQERDLGISDLHRATGINASTVYRICSTLVKRGYLLQSKNRGKYCLGTKFLSYVYPIKKRIKMREVVIPFMFKLSQEFSETAVLTSWDGSHCVIIEVVPIDHPLKASPREGDENPLYATSSGKVILANISEDEQNRYFSGTTLKKYTPNTITDLAELKNLLIKVREEGFAVDQEDLYLGINSVASVIRDSEGKVIGSFAVVGPSVRLTQKRIQEKIETIRKFSSDISKAMGYTG